MNYDTILLQYSVESVAPATQTGSDDKTSTVAPAWGGRNPWPPWAELGIVPRLLEPGGGPDLLYCESPASVLCMVLGKKN